MIKSFLGKKIGMSQVFREDGIVVPVTLVEAGPCVVTQIKTQDTDGYEALQLGFGEVKRRNKPMGGHFRGSRLSRYVKEVKVDDINQFQVGQSLTVDVFQPGERVDIIGRSKGRGFAGVMKRHGFGGGPRTHGQSDRARAPGSIGGGTTHRCPSPITICLKGGNPLPEMLTVPPIGAAAGVMMNWLFGI